MGRPVDVPVVAPALAVIGLLVAVAAGSSWIAAAVADGRTLSVLVRFSLTVAAGFYYVVMYRVATGRTIHRR
jgi:hypothetical protein